MSQGSTEQFPKFFIQVRDSEGQVVPQGVFANFVDAVPEHFQKIADVVDAVGRTFFTRIEQMAKKPSSCSLEFGVDVGGEAGIPFVTKGSLGAEFKVTIGWEHK
jgi:Trypsin-co-occurring domain 1